jgi:hypothetical protein
MDADGFRPSHLLQAKLGLPTSKDQPPTTPPIRLGEAADALSLHATSGHHSDRYYDDDPTELSLPDDDLPPLYSDGPEDSAFAGAPILPLGPQIKPDAPALFLRDANTGDEYFIDKRLDTDPIYLEKQIEYLSAFPPRPFVQLRGTHTETVKKGDKTERNTIVDFDVKLDLTPFLYANINTLTAWRELRTAENLEKVRRGGLFASRAPGFGGRSTGAVQLETGDGKATLKEWCHRYCASHSGLKTMLLRRRVVGLDEELLRTKLENLARATHYRGHLKVTFPVQNERAEIYSDATANRWRLTWWVQWLFMFTLLFLFALPYLFLRTARYEVVFADWAFSRPGADGRKEYVSVSEAQVYNIWGRAVQKAILARKQGVLDQTDLRDADAPEPGFEGLAHSGDGGAAVGSIVRAGINAMNVVNRQFGWGADT